MIRFDKLQKLADFLDQLRHDEFNFGEVVAKFDIDGCGTVCCAIGWTPILFPDEVEWDECANSVSMIGVRGGDGYVMAAEKLFNMPRQDARGLFSPNEQHLIHGWGDFPNCHDKSTPEEVAAAIRHYIKIRVVSL